MMVVVNANVCHSFTCEHSIAGGLGYVKVTETRSSAGFGLALWYYA